MVQPGIAVDWTAIGSMLHDIDRRLQPVKILIDDPDVIRIRCMLDGEGGRTTVVELWTPFFVREKQ